MSLDATVAVPTYGRSEQVSACLASVLRLDPAPERALVVDDTPDDSIRALVEDLPVEYVRGTDPPSLTRARNLALRSIDTEWALFLDSDATLPRHYLERNIPFLVSFDAVGGSGVGSGDPASLLYRTFARIFRLPEGYYGRGERFPPTWTGSVVSDPGTHLWGLHGSNMLLRNSALPVDLFEGRMERYSLWEDLDASMTLHRLVGPDRLVSLPVGIDHQAADEGRIHDTDLFRMQVLHMHWLAWKHFESTPSRERILHRAHLGTVMLRMREDPRNAGHWAHEGNQMRSWALQNLRPHARQGAIAFNDVFGFLQSQNE